MRVAVVGASGNVGTQLVRHLLDDPAGHEIVGVCRRPPADPLDPRITWLHCDVAVPESATILRDGFAGADAVVHLAWILTPSHDRAYMAAVNVEGSRRVFAATADAGVPALVYASSVGAYSPGPKDRRVDENWPTDGIPTSVYSRHKAAVERILDQVEHGHPELRVVRMRPGLIFQRAAASEIARFFLGPLVPLTLARPALLPVVPRIDRLVLQALHATDAGQAYWRAVVGDVRGAFNLAAEPVLDLDTIARLLRARLVPVPAALVREVMRLSWLARLQPSEPGWLDMGRYAPLLDTTRARTELGWAPTHDAGEALLELLDGFAHKDGGPTPVLRPRPSVPQLLSRGAARVKEAARLVASAPRWRR